MQDESIFVSFEKYTKGNVMKPKVSIGSTAESIRIAHGIHEKAVMYIRLPELERSIPRLAVLVAVLFSMECARETRCRFLLA